MFVMEVYIWKCFECITIIISCVFEGYKGSENYLTFHLTCEVHFLTYMSFSYYYTTYLLYNVCFVCYYILMYNNVLIFLC